MYSIQTTPDLPMRLASARVLLGIVTAVLASGCSSTGSSGGGGGGGGGAGGELRSGGNSGARASGGAGAGGSGTSAFSGGQGGSAGAIGSSPVGGSSAGSGDGTVRGGSVGTGGVVGVGGRSAGEGGRSGSGGSTGGGGRFGGGGAVVGGAGAGGSTGGASGGDVGSGGSAGSGDDYVSDVNVAVHPQTNTILVVTWTQQKASDKTLLEFNFTGSEAMTSRGATGTVGAHRDVVLGVPEKIVVSVRIVNKVGSVDYKTKDYTGTTGAIPSGMPKPKLVSYDASLASPERYLFGSVEDSVSGCGTKPCDYLNPFWIYIMDRQGRVVWYWADPSNGASHAFPRVARDGEYVVIDTGRAGESAVPTGVLYMTLDRQLYQSITIPGIDDAIDVTRDGSVLYDADGKLRERNKQGAIRDIWTCPFNTPGADPSSCYCNAVNWVPEDDTVLLSFPTPNTVVQIDRKTGALVGQYGSAPNSYVFADSSWKLQFQHAPTITPQGTLLVSSHLPDFPYGSKPGPNQHGFEEFDIDRTNKKLTLKWMYKEGKEWAESKGMALRLANGNTLTNYGNGGVIREVTADKKTAFEVGFPAGIGDGYHNNMVGNNVLVADLYALNGGGPK